MTTDPMVLRSRLASRPRCPGRVALGPSERPPGATPNAGPRRSAEARLRTHFWSWPYPVDRATLQQRGRFLGHRRALEEARVLRAPQPHGIAEDEVVEIALGDEPVLDQLERLGQRVAHVDDVEMPDVGAV